MTTISSQADDSAVHALDTGPIPLRNPFVAHTEGNNTMTNVSDQRETDQTQRPAWQLPLLFGLLGVAVGAAIGAGTGMWWMMGVLGGTFPAIGTALQRNR